MPAGDPAEVKQHFLIKAQLLFKADSFRDQEVMMRGWYRRGSGPLSGFATSWPATARERAAGNDVVRYACAVGLLIIRAFVLLLWI